MYEKAACKLSHSYVFRLGVARLIFIVPDDTHIGDLSKANFKCKFEILISFVNLSRVQLLILVYVEMLFPRQGMSVR